MFLKKLVFDWEQSLSCLTLAGTFQRVFFFSLCTYMLIEMNKIHVWYLVVQWDSLFGLLATRPFSGNKEVIGRISYSGVGRRCPAVCSQDLFLVAHTRQEQNITSLLSVLLSVCMTTHFLGGGGGNCAKNIQSQLVLFLGDPGWICAQWKHCRRGLVDRARFHYHITSSSKHQYS